MVSKGGLDLRYRPVNSINLELKKKKKRPEIRHELVSWLKYKHLSYKHLCSYKIATEK